MQKFGIITEPSEMNLMTEGGGIVYLDITTKGRSASTPQRDTDINAILKMMKIIEGISNGPVYTIGSSPASGVVGGVFIGKLAGYTDLVSLNMGGTTCLCSLIYAGITRIISETTLGNRLKLPMIDVKTIGAGGGSPPIIPDTWVP